MRPQSTHQLDDDAPSSASLAGGDDRQARAGAKASGVQSWGLRSRLSEREQIDLIHALAPEASIADPGFWSLFDLSDDEILARCERSLDGERERGKRGKWSYDINRHLSLAKWFKKLRSMRDERQAA